MRYGDMTEEERSAVEALGSALKAMPANLMIRIDEDEGVVKVSKLDDSLTTSSSESFVTVANLKTKAALYGF